jgi:hypothetical protein
MSKIPKPTKKKTEIKSKSNYRSDDKFAYRSVIIAAILGGIFYVLSLVLNTELITIPVFGQRVIWNIIDISIKGIIIILFFLFMITSIGNYKELIGKPLDWKEILLLLILSLGQALLNLGVLIITLLGLIFIIVYLFLIQEI